MLLDSWQNRVLSYRQTVDRNEWIPDYVKQGLAANARQRQFLLLADVNEVFYGGAAGGGKTIATLTAAAQFVNVPGYSALLLRENFSDLGQPEAWIPVSKKWWYGKSLAGGKAEWSQSEHRWTFPSGATITFGYLERDDSVYQYDTASYQFIAIDELVQHTEWRYRFMFGRIRRPRVGPLATVPPRMRSASNPGGKGHLWVKSRFIDPATREPGAIFVPARLDDNAGNMDVDSYRRDSLAKLDPVTKARREMGDWDAVAAGRFSRETLTRQRYRLEGTTFHLPDRKRFDYGACSRFITVDPAATAEGIKKRGDPDYTVISTWAISPPGQGPRQLFWLDCHRFRAEIPEIVPQLQAAYSQWSPAFAAVEAVASNRAVLQLARRTGMAVREVNPRGLDKLVRATPAMLMLESGRVWLPDRAHWLDQAVVELLSFAGDGKTHDDVVDTLSYACSLMDDMDVNSPDHRPLTLGGRYGW